MDLLPAGGIGGFEGISICLLAMICLMGVEAYAASFPNYDTLTQRWRACGHPEPGVVLLVGLGILLRPDGRVAPGLIGPTAHVLGLMGMVSVGEAQFIDHLALNVPVWSARRMHSPGL